MSDTPRTDAWLKDYYETYGSPPGVPSTLDSIQRFGWFQTGMFARGSGEWIQYKDFATVRSMFEAILKLSP